MRLRLVPGLLTGLLLGALAPAWASSPAPGTPPSVVLSTPGALAPDAGDVAAQCRAGRLDFKAVAGGIRKVPWLEQLVFGPDTEAGRLMADYAVCSAAAANRSDLCRTADSPQACDNEMLRARLFYGAAAGSSEAQVDCERFAAASPLDRNVKTAAPRFCRAWIAAIKGGADERAAVSAVRAAGYEGPDMAFATLRPEDCAHQPAAKRVFDDCGRIARLVAALKAGRCEAEPLCRALSRGEPSACAPLFEQAGRAFCAGAPAYAKAVKRGDPSIAAVVIEPEQPSLRPVRSAKEIAEETEKKRKADMAEASAPKTEAALREARQAEETDRQEVSERRRRERQYQPKQAMQTVPPDVEKKMKEIEEAGRQGSAQPQQ